MRKFLTLAWFTLAAAIWAAAPPQPTGSDAWPQFRGPGGQGHASSDIPISWSDDQNVAWKTPLKGKGWSSPVVAAGKVWVTVAVTGVDKKINLRVVGADMRSGEIRHDVELFSITKPDALHQRNNLASPTPAVVGDRVIASFGTHGVGCVDATTGKVLWRNEKLKANYETGAGSSPVPYKDRVIITCDGADVQFVVALKVSNGEEAWRAERPVAAKAKKPLNERRAFSTPLVINVSKKDQVVIPGAQCVYSYDPDTGEELWRVTYTGFSNVPRPVFANGLVYVSSGYYDHALMAIKPDGQGDVTQTHVAWSYKESVPNVPSPIVVGSRLFMVTDKGIVTCLDALTGERKWTHRLNGNFTASLLAGGETVYAFADDGKATLFKAADKYELIGRNELKGRIQATPAAVEGSLIVRTEDALYRLKQRYSQ